MSKGVNRLLTGSVNKLRADHPMPNHVWPSEKTSYVSSGVEQN